VRARAARHRIGPPDHAHDQVTLGEVAARRGDPHPAERLVAEDQALLPRWRPAVLSPGDLPVGTAHAERDAVDQQLALTGNGIGELGHFERTRLTRHDAESAHDHPLRRHLPGPPAP
jgi:hypothetical protein